MVQYYVHTDNKPSAASVLLLIPLQSIIRQSVGGASIMAAFRAQTGTEKAASSVLHGGSMIRASP